MDHGERIKIIEIEMRFIYATNALLIESVRKFYEFVCFLHREILFPVYKYI